MFNCNQISFYKLFHHPTHVHILNSNRSSALRQFLLHYPEMYSSLPKGNRLHELAEEECPELPKGSRDKGSISPIPSSPKTPDTPSCHLSLPGKFSLSGHTSPHVSPATSPNKTTHPPSSPHASAHHLPHPTPVTSPPPQKQHSSSPSCVSHSPSPVRSPVKSSPSVVISAPVKSRIAMCTEKEKETCETQKSCLPHSLSVSSLKGPQSPHSSPRISANSSPSALWRQSPIDRPLPVSPRSTESSRAGSVVSTKASSPRQVPSIKVKEREGREMPKKATSAPTDDDDDDDDDVYEDSIPSSRTICSIPGMYSDFPKGEHLHELAEEEPPELPPRPHFIMQEGDMHVQDIEDDTTLFDDKKGMKPGHTDPILDGQPASNAKDTEYNRPPPAIGGPPSSGLVTPSNALVFVPKSKRRWLHSPSGHWKGSAGNVEDASNNRQGGRGGKREEWSDSSTASEGEEQSSSGMEEEEDETLGFNENSLDRGSMSRSVIIVHVNA